MLETNIKSTILDRPRKLIINSDLIEFDNTTLIDPGITSFSRNEVSAFRFGIRFIRGYSFTFGRKYYIDIKGLDNRIIKIRLITWYGIRKNAIHQKFNNILKAFFDTHHKDIVNHYLVIFNSHIEVNILDTKFRMENVVIKGKEIGWDDLGTKAYTTYYALYAKSQPTIYQSYNYLEDWNAAVIYSLSRTILSDKKLL